MPEPIETIIIKVQQSFEIAGGLNPFQIEIEDDIKLIEDVIKYAKKI